MPENPHPENLFQVSVSFNHAKLKVPVTASFDIPYKSREQFLQDLKRHVKESGRAFLDKHVIDYSARSVGRPSTAEEIILRALYNQRVEPTHGDNIDFAERVKLGYKEHVLARLKRQNPKTRSAWFYEVAVIGLLRWGGYRRSPDKRGFERKDDPTFIDEETGIDDRPKFIGETSVRNVSRSESLHTLIDWRGNLLAFLSHTSEQDIAFLRKQEPDFIQSLWGRLPRDPRDLPGLTTDPSFAHRRRILAAILKPL